ncbi:MAG TPA: CPBP family intramembrane glutamic endopeptidase [Bryobacteraceae bacterium]|nr:CPBP family intramembrane glutamic endopeptidase [Bryobacteraceae bacterium]
MNAADEPQWDWTELGLFLGLGVPVFLAAYVAGVGFMSTLGVGSKGLRLLLPQFVAYGAAIVPLWVVFQRRHGMGFVEALRMNIPSAWVGRSVAYGVAAALGVQALGALLRMPKIETPMEDLLRDAPSLAVAGLGGVTVGPWFEELLFRGLLQPLVIRAIGVTQGIFLAALPFALLHGPQYAWSWRHVVLITVAGAAFGWHRWRTGSTGAAVLMHAAYNALLFTLFLIGRWATSNMPGI